MTNYNLTTLWAGNNIYDYFLAVNDLSGQVLSMALLAIIFMVLYFVTSSSSFSRKLLIASFGTTLVSVGLWGIGLVGSELMIIFTVLSIATLIYDGFN